MTRLRQAFLGVLLLLVAPPADALEGVPDHTGKRVAGVLLVGPPSIDEAELSRFLEIRKGDTYSARKVRRTIEVLAKLGNYSRIEVDATETSDGVVLTIRLDPVPRIRRIVLEGVSGARSRVTNALGVSTGDPYSGEADLRRMEDNVLTAYVRAGWRQAKVQVTARPEPDGDVVLVCTVEEGERLHIRDVEVDGDFLDVFDEETLVRETRLDVGDPLTASTNEIAGDRVIDYLRKLGYLEARVDLRSRETQRRVEAAIAEGVVLIPLWLGERIQVRFDKKPIAWADQRKHLLWFWDFRDSRLLALLELESETTFTEGFAAEASERIVLYYQRRGYFEAQVSEEIAVHAAKRRKTITFDIRPGRRFRLQKVAFRGTETLPSVVSPRALLRELNGSSRALRDRYYVPDEVDDAVLHVTNYLRSHGYDEARIEPDEPVIDRTRRVVRLGFEVIPGPRSIVGHITFSGNAEVAETKLRELVGADALGIREGEPLNAVFLDRSEAAVEEYYDTIGFPYADARYSIEAATEDAPPEAGDVASDSGPPPGPAPTPEPGPEPEPPESQASFGTNGHGTAAPRNENLLDVHYDIEESFKAFIGRIIIRGNHYTKREAIERALPFKTGQTYTPEALADGQDALYKLGPFARVSVVPTEEGEPVRVRDILVDVSEANRIVVEPSIGVSWPEEGPRVGLRAQHRNLFGGGESLSLRAQANWRWTGLLGETQGVNRVAPAVDYAAIEERVLLTYAQPTFLGFQVNGSVTTSLFEREQNRAFGYTGNRIVSAADQRLDFDLPVLRHADVRLVGRYQMFLRDIQYESRSQSDAVAVVREDFQFPVGEMFYWPLKWKIASGSLGALVDARNDRFNPTAGYTFTFNGEVADASIGSDADFMRFLAAWTLFRPAPAGFGVALSLRGGIGRPLGRSRGIPVDQRFHLGGTGSVRGFRESEIGPKFESVRTISTGGDIAASYNLELRHRLAGGFDWVIFHDAGWSRLRFREPDPQDVVRGRLRNPETLATSVGIGLRVKTLVGPIKFDLGVDTEALDQLDSINGTREHVMIHFTIGDF